MSVGGFRVLIAAASPDLAAQAAALASEDAELEVVGTPADPGQLASALEGQPVDAVLLHEALGPLPVMDLVRDLAARFPHVGLVVVVEEGDTRILKAALKAGARDVIEMPLTLEELTTGLKGAARWSRAVQRPAAGEDEESAAGGGRTIALAGAKGGVGTTTTALHLALAAVGGGRGRSVCLVDFDLQAGDVGVMLDVTHHRSVVDLADVTGDVSAQQLEGTAYVHASGLRVLLGPGQGERAEEMSAGVARRMLGALRSTYEVVVVDVGTVVTEAGAAAVEIADEVVVVVTPDVPAIRAANRLTGLWERLGVRRPDAKILVNRASRGSDVQPDLVRKVVELPLAATTVPAGFRDLEAAVNTGMPERVGDGGVRDAFEALARELGILGAARAAPRARLSLRAEAGQVAVETVGLAAVLLVVALLLWEAVLAGYTFVLAGHASREGARQFAVGREAEPAARADLPRAWREGMQVKKGENYVEVSLAVPAIVPGLESPARLTTRSGTVVEDDGGGGGS
jgi:pilus assembly protein CpaE